MRIKSRQKKNPIFKITAYVYTIICLLLLYFPIYWMFTSVTKDTIEASQIPPKLYFTVPNDFQIALDTTNAEGYIGKTVEEQEEQFQFEALDLLWMIMDRNMHLNCNSLEVVRVENNYIVSRAKLNNLTYSSWKNKSAEMEDGMLEELLFSNRVTENIINSWRNSKTETNRAKYQRLLNLLKEDGYETGLHIPYKDKKHSGEFSRTINDYLTSVMDNDNNFISDKERINLVTGKVTSITYSKNFLGMFNAFKRAAQIYGSSKFGYFRYFYNSVKLAFVQVVFTLFFTGIGGYAMACLVSKRTSKLCFYFIMISMMIPSVANILPLYDMYIRLGFRNTVMPFILNSMGSTYWMILFKGIFGSQANSLREAAKLDGASEPRIYFQIAAPLASGMFVVLGLTTFVGAWNSYFFEKIMLTDQSQWPLALVVQQSMSMTDSQGQKDVAVNMAMSIFAAIPTLIIFAFFQDKMVNGLSYEGLKG